MGPWSVFRWFRYDAALVVACLLLVLSGTQALIAAQEAPPVAKAHDQPGLLPEPRFLTTAFDFGAKYTGTGADKRDGFYPVFGGLYTGAGWISLGGGYRQHIFDDKVVYDTSASLSWRFYKLVQGRIEMPLLAGGHLTVGTQATWQDLTQVNYFGAGPDAPESDRSEYRFKSTDVVGYGRYRPRRWLLLGGGLGWLDRLALSAPVGPFDRGFPDARGIFLEEPVLNLERHPGFLHGELRLAVDTRDYPSHPMNGGLYRGSWAMFSDQALDQYSFRRYEAEAFHAIPIVAERFTLVAHGWMVVSDTRDDQSVPFYMLPSLGGGSTLRSFSDFRFHDRHMLVVNLESRIALFTHVDAAVFADAGNVARRVGDLTLDKRSYGAGLRLHGHETTTIRLDVAWGREGWRTMFSLNDPFRFHRLSRATSAVPFVP
jgi:hypothetical protein